MTKFRVDLIHSAGWCPICGDSGDLFFFKDISTDKIFFACDACGCAWKNSPDIDGEWNLLQPRELAPDGFSAATTDDIKFADLSHLIFRKYSNHNLYFDDDEGFK